MAAFVRDNPDGIATFGNPAVERILAREPETLDEAREQIRQLAEVARRTELDNANFIYRVSHDLKAPLRAIRTYAEFLTDDHAGELRGEAQTYLNRLHVNAEQVSQQLLGLLDLSRIGRWRKSWEPLDLDIVIRSVLDEFAERLEEKHVTCHIADGLPVIEGERQRIRQLLEFVFDNAVLYRREDGGHIWVESTNGEEAGPRITIRDDGIGIEERDHERVFSVFERIWPKEFPGVGMGLTLARRIMDYHRGEIWLDSQLGEGTAVHLRFGRQREAG